MTSSDDTGASDGKKSKQERIRDNQRRSRSRRQEYLSSLEKRLAECHTTCRNAEVQKTVLMQLQAENARLRELLTVAGVNTSLVHSYTNPRAVKNGSSLQQLKPKIELEQSDLARPDAEGDAARYFHSCRTTAPSQALDPMHNFVSEASPSYEALEIVSTSVEHMLQPALLRSDYVTPWDGSLPLQSSPLSNASANSFCDSFHHSPNVNLWEAEQNTML